jgi:hypothetical protein
MGTTNGNTIHVQYLQIMRLYKPQYIYILHRVEQEKVLFWCDFLHTTINLILIGLKIKRVCIHVRFMYQYKCIPAKVFRTTFNVMHVC